MWAAVLVYLVSVVVFSSAPTNLYLAFPVAAIAAHPNPPFIVYPLLSAAHVAGSRDGLSVAPLQPADEISGGLVVLGYPALMITLAIGLGVLVWRQRTGRG
jgi:hypothetical protein